MDFFMSSMRNILSNEDIPYINSGNIDKCKVMSQKEFTILAATTPMYYGYVATDFGIATAAFIDDYLCYFGFASQQQNGMERLYGGIVPVFLQEAVDLIIKKNINILMWGTPFQILVWRYLVSIERGAVVSYQYVADAVGRNKSVRAVANAIASNRIAYFIPCHRVIRNNGDMGGYRYGSDIKQKILLDEKKII
jgi:AraC family transcriptional regulator, regulatory protein of adaptative response / methylated-DNA-[protein]-cysteine methyltransferase